MGAGATAASPDWSARHGHCGRSGYGGRAGRPSRVRRWRSLAWILIGILILSYPVVATLYNDYRIQKQAQDYSGAVEKIDPPNKAQQYLAEARDYNARLARQGHHALPPGDESPGWQEYLSTLNAPETNGMMGRITIAAIDVDLPVYHGTQPDVLYEGAGHMFGSDLPVGGAGTNAVITAHTGMVDASMFDRLPTLKDGEIATVEVMGEKLHYRVTGRKVVKPDYWQAVTYEEGKDKLTLVTCTPYGINSDRLLVEAERVDLGSDGDYSWKPSFSWWMLAALAIIAIVLIIVAVKEWRRRRRRRQQADQPETRTGDGVYGVAGEHSGP